MGTPDSTNADANPAREGQRLPAAIVESALDAIIAADGNGCVSLFNPAAEVMFGCPAGEMLGRPLDGLFPEGLLTGSAHSPARSWAMDDTGSRRGIRARLSGRRADGQNFPIDASISRVTVDGQQHVTMVLRDITERSRSEELHARLAAIVEWCEEAIIGRDLEGAITTWNRGAQHLFGWGPEEMIGKTISLLLLPEQLEEEARMLAQLKRGERVASYETVRRHKDGHLVEVSFTASPIRDGSGRLIGISKIARDIAADKGARARLYESEERFRQLAENISEVFWMSNPGKTELLYVSPAYEAIWGRTCQSLYELPQSWLEAIHPDDRDRVLRATLTRQVTGGYDEEYRIIRPDHTVRWIRDRAFPVRDASGRVIRIAGVAVDITEQRQLELQLRQAQKMEAIGQLAGGVAHDFNNLIALISGYSELLAMDLPPDDPRRDSVHEIARAGERAAALTRQLLAFSRQQVLEPRLLDLNVVVNEAGKMLRRIIGEDICLITRLAPKLGWVRADLGQLDQVILNLAVNARDAMPRGGQLLIETREVELDAGYTQGFPDVRPGRYAVLVVSDTGCGMTPEVQARVFEPFFTTKEQGKGTGLGLSVVHGIVKQSGGHVSVDSSPGVGTTFKIYLPALEAPTEQDLGTVPGKPPGGNGELILLVEDEEPVRALTGLLLETLGYRVLEAGNGQEALRLVMSSREEIDLLLTDVVMPGISGSELAEAVRRRHPSLRVIFQTGYTGEAMARHGILQSEIPLLQKPFTLNALAQKVRETLERPLEDHHGRDAGRL